MKKVFLILVMQYSLFAFSQKNENWEQMTFKELAFSKPFNLKARTSQMGKDGNKRDLIPYQMNSDDVLKLYLLNCYDEKGSVEASQYIISKQGIPDNFDLFLIPINNLNVLYFDAVFLDNSYANKKNITGHSIIKIQGKEVDMNTPIAKYMVVCDNGGVQICDHWYWVWLEDDIIVDLIDLGETCSHCGGGSGGGGGTNENCEQRTQEFANQGMAVSGSVSASGGNNGDTWMVPYNWKIYSAGTWGLLSYEQGNLVRVTYGNKRRWEYETFIHQRIGEIGINIGGTRTFSDLGATINITPIRTAAYIRIDFSVTSSIGGICSGYTNTYNSNNIFTAPNNYVIVN